MSRMATPVYDAAFLTTQLTDYVSSTGVKKCFDLGLYGGMSLNQAVNGYGLIQNKGLLKVLVSVSPFAMFKVSDLKATLLQLSSTFSGLVPEDKGKDVNRWATKMAERFMVLLNHARRLKNSDVRLRQAGRKLDSSTCLRLNQLLSSMKCASATSEPFLMMLEDIRFEDADMDDAELDKDLKLALPMPPCKNTKKKKEEVAKDKGVVKDKKKKEKGAVDVAKCGIAAIGIAAKDIKYTLTCAKKQSYIQFLAPGQKKTLLIGVSAHQSKEHHGIVKVMYDHFCKNQTTDKEQAKSLRDALLM